MDSDSDQNLSRRTLLAMMTGGTATLAGCNSQSSDSPDEDADTGTPTPGTDTRTPTPTATETETETPTPTSTEPTVEGWPLPNATRRGTRYVPETTVPSDPPSETWRVEFERPRPPEDEYGSYNPFFKGPVTDTKLLFAVREAEPSAESPGTEQYLDAYELDGTRRWSVETNFRIGIPSVVGDTVFTIVDDTLVALDRETGEKRWSHGRDSSIFGYLADDDAVYVRTWDLVRSFTHDGQQRWSRELHSRYGLPNPVRAGDELYVATDTGAVALAARDGSLQRSYQVSGDRLYATESTLFVHEDPGEIRATDRTESGDVRWVVGNDEILPVTFATTNEMMIVATRERNLRAYDVATGETLWTVPDERVDSSGKIAISDESVLVGGPESLRAYTHAGAERWRVTDSDLGMNVFDPVVTTDRLYVTGQYDGEQGDVAVLAAFE